MVVLVSGSGSNLQSLIDTVHAPGGAIEIVLVVSSNPDVLALERAERAGIPTPVVAARPGASARSATASWPTWWPRREPDLVVLAGWMSILTGAFLDRFPDRVINLHPSLLPAFPGLHAIEQALAWGVRAHRGHGALRRGGRGRRSADPAGAGARDVR